MESYNKLASNAIEVVSGILSFIPWTSENSPVQSDVNVDHSSSLEQVDDRSSLLPRSRSSMEKRKERRRPQPLSIPLHENPPYQDVEFIIENAPLHTEYIFDRADRDDAKHDDAKSVSSSYSRRSSGSNGSAASSRSARSARSIISRASSRSSKASKSSNGDLMLFEEEKSRLKKHVCDELEHGSMDLDEIRDICRRSKMPGNSA